MSLTAGQILQNRYRILSQLSQGGMGVIYRARDTRLDIQVALKEMIPQPDLDPQTLAGFREQFRREAQILAQLDHPHLAGAIDFFEERGNVYLVMKFIEGEDLSDLITREGALPEAPVVRWAEQLLDTLAFCHSHGVVHRDIKPANVIIRPAASAGLPGDALSGDAVLVDFGLVKLWDPHDPRTRTAIRSMGTPRYIPPEQYEEELGHTDARSDIYSLGATLYHALTGEAPPTATQRMAAPEEFHRVRQLNAKVSPELEAVIMRALELARARRWESANDMKAALTGTRPVAPAVPARQPAARRRALWALPLLGLLLLVTFVLLRTLGTQDEQASEAFPPSTPTGQTQRVIATIPGTPVTPSPDFTPQSYPTAVLLTDTPLPLPSATPTQTRWPTPSSMPTRTPISTPEESVCLYGAELDEVRNPFDYWYLNSHPTFDLVLHNTGTCVWPEGTRLMLVSDTALDWPESWPVGSVNIGEQKEIEIELTAPGTAQILHIWWQLETPDGKPIGSRITYDLRVEPNPTPAGYGGAIELPPALDGESPAQIASSETGLLSTVATIMSLAVLVIVRFDGKVQRARRLARRLRSSQGDKGLAARPSG